MRKFVFQFSTRKMEVILHHEYEVPKCSHGPCLLFQRSDGDKFFACAVARSRKLCSFYKNLNDPTKCSKRIEALETYDHEEGMKRLQKLKALDATKRKFCQTCSCLIFQSEKGAHKGHEIDEIVSDSQLKYPTTLMRPFAEKQKEAQYWFSERTISVLKSIIKDPDMKIDAILCIGSPRFYEKLQPLKKQKPSFLLDVDGRFNQFWSPKKFAQFSMLTNYFYTEKEAKNLDRFLKTEGNLLIFIDPPFGVLLSPLAETLKEIAKKHEKLHGSSNSQAYLALTLPYFLDKKVYENFPNLKPLDYKVEYESLGGTSGKAYTVYKDKSHPVRIFTNLPLDKLKLPAGDYKLCEPCKRYVSKENVHCKFCNNCPMRGSVAYKHCGRCKKCVPSNIGHCDLCKKCHKEGKCTRDAPNGKEEKSKKREATLEFVDLPRRKVKK